jgi:hypothetical protein
MSTGAFRRARFSQRVAGFVGCVSRERAARYFY